MITKKLVLQIVGVWEQMSHSILLPSFSPLQPERNVHNTDVKLEVSQSLSGKRLLTINNCVYNAVHCTVV